MSILASLNRAYERLAERHEVPPFGYSSEKIGFVISLNEDGSLAGAPSDLRQGAGKKLVAPMMSVPASFKRPGITPRSFFLWDNTAYCLGVTASDTKDGVSRLSAFKDFHRKALSDSEDEGLLALSRFIENWQPEMFEELGWPDAMKDQNVVFALESQRLSNIYIHDRPAAQRLWANLSAAGDRTQAVCLVTGEMSPIARLHPSIKNVWGGQTSGVSLVSYNKKAFESYGHEDGDNAPVSEAATFAYTAALNKFLETGSSHRIQIGDSSTVFWADASDAPVAQLAEDAFLAMYGTVNEAKQAEEVGAVLEKIRLGQPLGDFSRKLGEGVRFYVLGLAPNAARVSIRFFYEDTFGQMAENYRVFLEEMRVEPAPKGQFSFFTHLCELALQHDSKNIPANLAGEWFHSVLMGTSYPQTLLPTMLMRIRADKTLNGRRAAIIKAVICRNFLKSRKDELVSLDQTYPNPAYHLGRLFAVLENFQKAALGDINRTIRDGYFGTAMTAPSSVFPRLLKLNGHHRSKANKEHPGWACSLEMQLADIANTLPPNIPNTLSLSDQGLFAIGYFHQANFRKAAEEAPAFKKEAE